MTFKSNFNTSKVARANTSYPQAVLTDNYIFVSGMPGIDPKTGAVVNDNFEDQLRQSFQNIQTVLKESGSDLSKIVKTTIFMVTGNEFGIVNKVYSEIFPDNPPARSTPQVMPFPAGMLVSVECIALV